MLHQLRMDLLHGHDLIQGGVEDFFLRRVAGASMPLMMQVQEIAALLEEQAEEAEKVLPRILSFVVTPEQEVVIEQAVELASDGTPGRDRKARGLTNLAERFLKERNDAEGADQEA